MNCPVCGKPGDTPSGRCASCVIANAAMVWQATNAPILLSLTSSPQRVEEPLTGVLCPGCSLRSQGLSGFCAACEVVEAVTRYTTSRVSERKRFWDRRQLVEVAS